MAQNSSQAVEADTSVTHLSHEQKTGITFNEKLVV